MRENSSFCLPGDTREHCQYDSRDGAAELLTVCLPQVKHQSVSMVVEEVYMQSWTSEAGCVLVVCDEEEEQMSGGGG